MKSDRSGLVSLSQANAGSSSHLPKEVRAALRSPGRLEASSSAPAYISSGHLLSRPWICCQVEHIYFASCQCFPFQIIFVIFTLWKYCYDYSGCGSVRVAENWLDGFMPAGSHENSWAGGTAFVRYCCFLSSSLHYQSLCILVPPVPTALSYITHSSPSCLSLGHSVTFPLTFQNLFHLLFLAHTHTPFFLATTEDCVGIRSEKELNSTCGMLQMGKLRQERWSSLFN